MSMFFSCKTTRNPHQIHLLETVSFTCFKKNLYRESNTGRYTVMLRHISKRVLGRECVLLEQRTSDAGIARFLSTGNSNDLKTVLSEKVPAEQVRCMT